MPNTPENCPSCGWPLACDGPTPLSEHAGSAGAVRYLRCVCGAWLVTVAGAVVATPGNR